MSNLGNKEIMAKNIQYYMDKYEKSRQDMCEALGVKYTTFTDWVKGNSYPRIDKIELMANYFGISKADLVEEHVDGKVCPTGVSIPVYGRVAAGLPIEMSDEVLFTTEISERMARTGEFFGLHIHGDSMEPRMHEGDIVIVRRQPDAETGEIVIVAVDGTDATCKKLQKLQNGINLISINDKYDPKFFSNEEIERLPVTILGRVVELRVKF